MSRHAAPIPAEERNRLGNLGSAVIAAVITVALLVLPQFGRPGLLAAIAGLQVAFVYAWVIGTNLPGRIGGTLIGLGAAAACDALLHEYGEDGLAPLLKVYAVVFVVATVHQLVRGVVRVRVTESLAGILMMCAVVAAASCYIALDETTGGETLVAASVTATGLAVTAGHLVDAMAPVPHFDTEVPRGLLAVVVSTVVGAGVAWLRIDQSTISVMQYGGLILGGVLGLVVALVGVGLGYVAESTRPRRAPFAGLAVPYIRVAVPVALSGPLAYFVGLAVTS